MRNIQAMFTAILVSVVSALALVPAPGTPQRRPNLSGKWVLVAATTSGPSREPGSTNTPQTRAERPIRSNTISGAPFNCGRQCTIVQQGEVLMIDKAFLSSNATPAPAVTLRLDGRAMSAVDSFNPGRPIPLASRWTGDKVEVATSDGRYTQILSIDAGQLVVVTTSNIGGVQRVTFRYGMQ